MRLNNIISLFIGLPLLLFADTVIAQTPQKPKIQTSAQSGETIYKPQSQAENQSPTSSGKAPAKTEVKAKAKTPVRPNKEKAAPFNKTEKSKSSAKRYMALKNNLAFQAVALQNLAFEMQVHDHISVELPLTWSFWDMEREHAIRTVALQPEGRWWLKETGKGHFFGLHAHVAWFNVKWNKDRYQSAERPLLGAGISYGYKLPLGEHWGAEFSIGAGYANMKYDTYYNIENGAKLNTYIRNYWGITRIGLSLVYRF